MVLDDGKPTVSVSLTAEQQARLKAYHDIRASMAIINGFGQALDNSFRELVHQYQSAVSQLPPETDAQIQELQFDCTFHLSRLVRAVEQLKVRLEKDALDVVVKFTSDNDAKQ